MKVGFIMILYKYKSLANLEHVRDIVLYERLYCSPYDKLNDPFEGLFLTAIKLSYSRLKALKVPFPPHLVNISIKQYKNIEDLPFDWSKTRICSLSYNLNDVRLWSYYADGHKGVVFEIDFSGIDQVYKVNYCDKLPTFGNSILTSPLPHEVLTRKTKHWAFEEEYRIIHSSEYFPISNRIKAIYAGVRISNSRYDLLKEIVANNIPIICTKINKDEIKVEPNQTPK